MNMRNMAAALTLALGTFATATVGQSAILEFNVGVAPPPERVEVVPAPRTGYLYEPGHYVWNGTQWVWAEGQFIRNREGHVWRPHVVERRGDTFYFRAGHWDDD